MDGSGGAFWSGSHSALDWRYAISSRGREMKRGPAAAGPRSSSLTRNLSFPQRCRFSKRSLIRRTALLSLRTSTGRLCVGYDAQLTAEQVFSVVPPETGLPSTVHVVLL